MIIYQEGEDEGEEKGGEEEEEPLGDIDIGGE